MASLDVQSAQTIVSSLTLNGVASMEIDSALANAAILNLLGTATIKASFEQVPEHILKELRGHPIADPTISTLIGTRINPMRLPQNVTFPAITYHRISHEHEHHLDSAAGFAMPRIQIDCWSEDLAERKEMSEAVRAALQGFSGMMGSIHAMSVVTVRLRE